MDMTEVVVAGRGGTFHRAYQDNDTGVLSTPEGCNLDDARTLELYPAIPDWVDGEDLCKRCYSTSTDR